MTKSAASRARIRALGTTGIAAGGFAVGSMAMGVGLTVTTPGAFADHTGLVARTVAGPGPGSTAEPGATAAAPRTATTAATAPGGPAAPYRFAARRAGGSLTTKKPAGRPSVKPAAKPTAAATAPKAPVPSATPTRPPAPRRTTAAPKPAPKPAPAPVTSKPRPTTPSRPIAPPPVNSGGS